MRKVIFATIAIGLLTFTSCKKSGPGAAGYWTFLGSAYDASSCSATYGQLLTASNLTNNNIYTYGTIECNFYNSLPTTTCMDTVVAYPPHTPHQVSINTTIGGGSVAYTSTGGGGTETVAITVNNGYVSVKGSNIEMAIDSSGVFVDSSVLYIDITQTQ